MGCGTVPEIPEQTVTKQEPIVSPPLQQTQKAKPESAQQQEVQKPKLEPKTEAKPEHKHETVASSPKPAKANPDGQEKPKIDKPKQEKPKAEKPKQPESKPKEKPKQKEYADGLTHNKFFSQKVFRMVGGYFVKPKIGHALQHTQLLISAASKTPISLRLAGPGKVGMIACVRGKTFPLEIITDLIQATQIVDKKVEMTIDSPGPGGFALYVISEGDLCELTVDAGQYLVLDVAHGDLMLAPPAQQKLADKKKRSQQLVLREKTWLSTYTMNMHGGEIVGQNKDEELDDTQFVVNAPTGNHVLITAAGQGQIALLAMGAEETFPIQAVTDDVLGYVSGQNQVSMEVRSPGPEGFVVVVMSNFSEVKINVDGQGKLIPCISHSDDHAIEHRSSCSKSSRSSIYRREEFRCEVTKLNFVNQVSRTVQGAQEVDCEPGVDLQEAQQILVYATSDCQVKCELEGSGAVGLMVMERDSFPLVKSTRVISSALKQIKKVALTTQSPGVRGMIYYVMGDGEINVKISAGEKTMVQVAFPK